MNIIFFGLVVLPKTFKDNKKLRPHQKSMHTEVQIISLR